jgi:hypothetical protein
VFTLIVGEMKSKEFNEKYKDFIEEGHYGLAIDVPEVVIFLDQVFAVLTKTTDFSFKQIKEKFNFARVYTTGLGDPLESFLEKVISNILNKKDE